MSNESPFLAPANDAGIPAAPPQPLKPNRGLLIAMGVLGGVYVVLCVVEIFVLMHRVSLLNQLTGDVNADADLLHGIDSAASTVNTVSWIAVLAFLSTIVVLSIWLRRMRSTWGPTGQYQRMLKESGYQIFRIVWIVSLVLSIFLRGTGTQDTIHAMISHDHSLTVYFGIRAVLGVALVYFAIRFARVSARILTLTQAGYSQDAVNYLSS